MRFQTYLSQFGEYIEDQVIRRGPRTKPLWDVFRTAKLTLCEEIIDAVVSQFDFEQNTHSYIVLDIFFVQNFYLFCRWNNKSRPLLVDRNSTGTKPVPKRRKEM